MLSHSLIRIRESWPPPNTNISNGGDVNSSNYLELSPSSRAAPSSQVQLSNPTDKMTESACGHAQLQECAGEQGQLHCGVQIY